MVAAGASATTNIGNPNLRWEQSKSTSFGLDLDLLSGRVNVVADYYIKSTRNTLQQINLPTNTGYSTMWTNSAHIENKGVELYVAAYPIPKTTNFAWQTIFNFFKNKNRIISLDRPDYVYNSTWLVASRSACRKLLRISDGHLSV